MDEDQIAKLGDKMKAVYSDVVDDAETEVGRKANQVSRRSRRTRAPARKAARGNPTATIVPR